MFDELLARRAGDGAWQPFDTELEYRTYVDGRPRRDGLRNFLAARGIEVPEGSPGDDADAETIYGLGARKNRYMLELLDDRGVEVYGDALALVDEATDRGLRLAVVTASRNAAAVLAAAQLSNAFDIRVDGNDLELMKLRGKPAPDSFLEAARRLEIEPGRIVVLEDAIAGVEAARAGGFGLVIGVDRAGHGNELREAGADLVVTSLYEVQLDPRETHAELR
jgi:HAD superfamily hydrolase (TIGR01509 family)